MRDEAAGRALDYLAGHHVMTLATNGPLGLWAAAVFYANDSFQLHFLSAGHTRHAQNIAASREVAATIQGDYADWAAIKGIQLEGIVRMLAGKEREAAIALYAKKHSFLDPAYFRGRDGAAASQLVLSVAVAVVFCG